MIVELTLTMPGLARRTPGRALQAVRAAVPVPLPPPRPSTHDASEQACERILARMREAW